jgi:thiol:disulfide interchange protein
MRSRTPSRRRVSSKRLSAPGLSTGNLVLCILVATIMALGGVMVFRSLAVQKQVAVTFVGWYEDKKGYDKALADQKTMNKPMLVYIYAPWCPHCKRFSAQVLADRKMRAFVQGYPHVRISPDNGEGEKKIMEEFGAQGYPSFYVVMPDQKRIQIETFTSGTPDSPPRLKTPVEFMKSILQATGGQ